MTGKDFTYDPVFSQLLSPAPSVTARGSHSFARHTVYSAMQRGSREQKMLLGPMSVLATKEQATPTWKKSRVQPKNFAFTVWVLSLFRKTSVTAMVNCFRLFVENKVELAKPFAPLKLFHWKAVAKKKG